MFRSANCVFAEVLAMRSDAHGELGILEGVCILGCAVMTSNCFSGFMPLTASALPLETRLRELFRSVLHGLHLHRLGTPCFGRVPRWSNWENHSRDHAWVVNDVAMFFLSGL